MRDTNLLDDLFNNCVVLGHCTNTYNMHIYRQKKQLILIHMAGTICSMEVTSNIKTYPDRHRRAVC